MNDEPLMEIVADTVLFLELSDHRTVDEDAAVAMLEQIAATLQTLGPVEKERFLQYLQRRAAEATTHAEREAIEHLPSNLGLTSD